MIGLGEGAGAAGQKSHLFGGPWGTRRPKVGGPGMRSGMDVEEVEGYTSAVFSLSLPEPKSP